LRDIIKGNSPYVSTGGDCEPYACDISVVLENAACESGVGETLSLAMFRYEDMSYNLKEGTISVSGKCNIKEIGVA
jgi:hypothetical protein